MERHNLRIKWTTPVAQTAESCWHCCWPWQHKRISCSRRSPSIITSHKLRDIHPFRRLSDGRSSIPFQSIGRRWSAELRWEDDRHVRLRERSAGFCRDPPHDTRSLAYRTSRTAARRKGESDVGGRRLAVRPWFPVVTSVGGREGCRGCDYSDSLRPDTRASLTACVPETTKLEVM